MRGLKEVMAKIAKKTKKASKPKARKKTTAPEVDPEEVLDAPESPEAPAPTIDDSGEPPVQTGDQDDPVTSEGIDVIDDFDRSVVADDRI